MFGPKLERNTFVFSYEESSGTPQSFDDMLGVAQNFISKFCITVAIEDAHTRLKYAQSSQSEGSNSGIG